MRIRFLATLILAVSSIFLSSCAQPHGNLSRKGWRHVYNDHPIAVDVRSKYIDEETPLQYTVHFRNVGTEILSFDYTLADQRGVPHVDRNGPNSGFIPNLYPGAEVEVPNTVKRKNVWATLGNVTMGKKPVQDLDKIYKSDSAAVADEIQLGQ